MANLYEIDAKLATLIENAFDLETGEVYEDEESLAKAIDECQMDLETKLENLGLYIKNLSADIEMFKKEEEKLKERRKSAERKIDGLKKYLDGYLSAVYPNEDDKAKWKMKTARVQIGFRKSTTVEVPDITKLAKKFIKKKVEESADKVAIKEALKAGEKVKGAYLQDNINLSVK